MLKVAHRFLAVLIVFALIGSPTAHLAQPALVAAQMMADMPCDMTMPMTSPTADAGQGTPMLPCKGLTPDCMKQMGCVVDVALPARLASADLAVPFSTVDYWSAWPSMSGVVRAPEPLPPRTA